MRPETQLAFQATVLYTSSDSETDCTLTQDFFRQTSCAVIQELSREQPNIAVDSTEHDDIVISVFSVKKGTGVVQRYPTAYGQAGWSYALDIDRHTGAFLQLWEYGR